MSSKSYTDNLFWWWDFYPFCLKFNLSSNSSFVICSTNHVTQSITICKVHLAVCERFSWSLVVIKLIYYYACHGPQHWGLINNINTSRQPHSTTARKFCRQTHPRMQSSPKKSCAAFKLVMLTAIMLWQNVTRIHIRTRHVRMRLSCDGMSLSCMSRW